MTPDRAVMERALAGLFPAGVAVAAVRIGEAGLEPLPSEERAVAGAVPARRAEFAAGRAAARLALGRLGYPRVAIPAGADRAPVWPRGVAGSISHAAGWAVAVVREGGPLGVDVEGAEAVMPDLWPVVCDGAELSALPEVDRAHAVTRVFSAKEAVFKAQYPLTGAVIGFDAVAVALDGDGFTARFRRPAGLFGAGHRMAGRFARVGGVIVSGVAA